MANYLDPAAFTDLFRNNAGNRNRRRILAGLHLMAGEISRKFHVLSIEQLEDAAGAALLVAAAKIDCFDCRRRDAFSYFTSIIYHAIDRALQTEAKHHRQRTRFFTDSRGGEGGVREVAFSSEQVRMAW